MYIDVCLVTKPLIRRIRFGHLWHYEIQLLELKISFVKYLVCCGLFWCVVNSITVSKGPQSARNRIMK